MILPLVYIVILNWNGIEDTVECLESLKKVTYPNYRVVVVDNGSSNNEADIIVSKFPDIGLIKNDKNEGYVIANNQGVEFALKNGADYVLLLNNDTVVKTDFLDILIKYAEGNSNVGIVAPKILYYGSDKRLWSVGGRISYCTGLSIMIGKGKDSSHYKKIAEPDFVSGCAILVKKTVIDNIGLLDPIYFAYYEDADYCFRARKAGYGIAVIPESIIWHKKSASAGIRGSSKITPTQAFLWARNGLVFGKRNIHGVKFAMFFMGQFTFKLLLFIFRSSTPRAAYNYLLGLFEGLKRSCGHA